MKIEKTSAPIVQTFEEYLPAPFIDAAAEGTYYGYAPMGTSEDEDNWRIMKEIVVGTVTKRLYAQGTMDFVSIWSQRSTYNYSR